MYAQFGRNLSFDIAYSACPRMLQMCTCCMYLIFCTFTNSSNAHFLHILYLLICAQHMLHAACRIYSIFAKMYCCNCACTADLAYTAYVTYTACVARSKYSGARAHDKCKCTVGLLFCRRMECHWKWQARSSTNAYAHASAYVYVHCACAKPKFMSYSVNLTGKY